MFEGHSVVKVSIRTQMKNRSMTDRWVVFENHGETKKQTADRDLNEPDEKSDAIFSICEVASSDFRGKELSPPLGSGRFDAPVSTVVD